MQMMIGIFCQAVLALGSTAAAAKTWIKLTRYSVPTGSSWLAVVTLLLSVNLAGQVQPASNWCSTAHCDNQMTDLVLVPSNETWLDLLTSGGPPSMANQKKGPGVGAGLGCVSNGKYVACSNKTAAGQQNAVVLYDGNGKLVWGSCNYLGINTWGSAPIIQSDNSVIIGDELNIYQFTLPAIHMNGCSVPVPTIAWQVSKNPNGSDGAPVSLVAMQQGSAEPGTIVAATRSEDGKNAPVSIIHNTATSPTVAYTQLQSGGLNYQSLTTPCVNDATNPNHVYISSVAMGSGLQSPPGMLWALNIDPTQSEPISVAWSYPFVGSSGASPLCVGDSIFFDGGAGQNGSPMVYGLADNGSSSSVLPGFPQRAENAMTCNFALDPRSAPTGTSQWGFWHQGRYDPNLYHVGFLGTAYPPIDMNSLLTTTVGAPIPPAGATYWMRGVFTTYGTISGPYVPKPYMLVSESDFVPGACDCESGPLVGGRPTACPELMSYLVLLNLETASIVWAWPIPATTLCEGGPQAPADSIEGTASVVLDSGGNPWVVTAAASSGPYFLGGFSPTTHALPH
jgi:hypothetical protein